MLVLIFWDSNSKSSSDDNPQLTEPRQALTLQETFPVAPAKANQQKANLPFVESKSIGASSEPALNQRLDIPVAGRLDSRLDGRLIDNWDLSGTGLTKEALAPLMQESQPSAIYYFDENGMKRIDPLQTAVGTAQSDKAMFISDETAIKKVQADREAQAAYFSSAQPKGQETRNLFQLPINAFEIVAYRPGKRYNGETLQPVSTDLVASLQGPDYSFEAARETDETAMRARLAKVLPLGNSGQLMLKVMGSGALIADAGFDFSIFQTSFRIAGTNKFWQKFGAVGVSDRLDSASFTWFKCDPQHGVLDGCAGVVPTSEGGDRFLLAQLGLRQIRFIWIKDIGSNKDFSSQWPTEGLNIDAVRLDHAFIPN